MEAESGRRVHAHGENANGRSNARVAKNGDPRLKTEQRQGMQRVAAHLAVSRRQRARRGELVYVAAHTAMDLRLDRHETRT